MRTSHKQIRKRILEVKSKISDEEFFASKAYRAYLMDITESATRRYKQPLKVTVVADHNDPTLAYTDISRGTVYINACNEITWSMPSRRLRSLSIEGLNAHENGHNLFTDGSVWNAFIMKLQKGKFYPHTPKRLTAQQKVYAKEIQTAMLDDGDEVPRAVLLETAHTLSNILEDGYVDARYSLEFPGTPARGIALNNLRIAEQAPDIQDMIDKKFYDHRIIENLLIQYINAGEVNNLSGYSGELLDVAVKLIPIVDDCVHDEDARGRCDAANRILIELWPTMQRCFDALRDMQKQSQQNGQSQQPSGSGSGQPQQGQQQNAGDPGQGGQEALQAIQAALQSQVPNLPQNPTESNTPVSTAQAFVPNQQQQKDQQEAVKRVLAEETSRIAAHVTHGIDSEGDGEIITNTDYAGNGYQYAASDIERILEEMAEGIVHEAMEEELSEELQREANAISYGNAHRGVNVTVNRMSQVDPDLVDDYNAVAPELLRLSKRLQKSVSAALRDKRQDGKQTGLLAGKRLNQHALYRDDGRLFYNTRLPMDPINLAVGLLIDESGSMGGSDRITKARATAIVVQDFCEKLGIPLEIMGHTASSCHVELFSYASFDSVDQKDRYRLMDMSARSCNRDGAALRFAAEKLYRYPADAKMLILISDGQPNDHGYSGTAAEADLRGIKQEYERKGVKIFAAAIGDDRDRIERIYGTGYLDITDLNKLPITLTNLIARNLPI